MPPKKNNVGNNKNNETGAQTNVGNNNNNETGAQTNLNSSQQQQKQQPNKGKKGGGQRVGGDGPRAAPVRRSKRAGVVFPVHRIRRDLKNGGYGKILGYGASVYMAGVLEYLVAEVVELAGNAAQDNKKKRITPRHLFLAIRKDEELNQLLGDVTIASGGVIPNIHQVLLPPSHYGTESMKGDEPVPKKKKQTKKKTNAADSALSADSTVNSTNATDNDEESPMD